ncbi:DUF3515 domain-containing protein [Streptomyces sp. NPDC002588]|uniref:DUF3515 domain-containing protein n=1 Tax=Streptomyces sp. NPDC002588 TaxID=3154419 RepID=UPI0033262E7B
MNFLRHRLKCLPALVLLCAAVGCSSADDRASAAVPSPAAKAAKLCRNLDAALPSKVDGQGRRDPEPASALTAGWGDAAIILRCGVERPAKMSDSLADSGEVNGVAWLMEKQRDGRYRCTTALRLAYVEVTLPGGDGAGPLVDLASAIKKAIPEGIAD